MPRQRHQAPRRPEESRPIGDNGGVVESLLLLTFDPPRKGAIVNVDGLRYRVLRVLSWTGTVARLEIERIDDCR